MKAVDRSRWHGAFQAMLALATTAGLAACTTAPRDAADATDGVICQWGYQQFDLCRFDSHDEMIEALLAEMTLEEKIGQMTMSIWHNNVTPEVIRDRNIGAIVHTDGPVPGPTASDWVSKFNEFQEIAFAMNLFGFFGLDRISVFIRERLIERAAMFHKLRKNPAGEIFRIHVIS